MPQTDPDGRARTVFAVADDVIEADDGVIAVDLHDSRGGAGSRCHAGSGASVV